MAEQFLRIHSGLTSISNSKRPQIVSAMTRACGKNFYAFFRLANNVITFMECGTRFRIDVSEANDSEAHQQMGLRDGDEGKMFYAQLQAGKETYATIVYPQNDEMVQIGTLIAALQMSIENGAVYTAIG